METRRIKTMDVNVRVPGLEKLLDYAASGVGAIAGPMLANWIASREGKARLTSTHFDAEVRLIETESKARSLQIIADAQAQARQSIDTTIESGHGTVEITRDDIIQSIEFQGRKRLFNARSVVEDAADELGDKEVSDHEPDPDWTARFFFLFWFNHQHRLSSFPPCSLINVREGVSSTLAQRGTHNLRLQLLA